MTLGEGENDKIPADVMEAASAWLLRFEEDFEEDEASNVQEHQRLKAELGAWLAADEAHRLAWELAQRAWSVAEDVRAETDVVNTSTIWQKHPPPHSKTPLAAGQSAKTQRLAAWIRRAGTSELAVPAILAMFLLFMLAPTFPLWIQSDFRTSTAATRSFSLDDGSQIVMGAESAVARDFSGERREVALLRGEVWFEVARDQTRPFIITVGAMTISVTGTAFNVAMTDRTIAIALASGSVVIERAGKTPLQKTLKPGQRLAIDREDGAMRITSVDPALMGGWRSGQLIVHGARLADVVDTIDRYYHGAITLIGRSVANRRVTGVFDLDNPEKALKSLVSPYGASTRKLTPWHTVVLAI